MDPLLTEISSKFYSELLLSVSEALSTPYKNLYAFFCRFFIEISSLCVKSASKIAIYDFTDTIKG
jgi:hypothetical protein